MPHSRVSHNHHECLEEMYLACYFDCLLGGMRSKRQVLAVVYQTIEGVVSNDILANCHEVKETPEYSRVEY
jgi:hypothetical protein